MNFDVSLFFTALGLAFVLESLPWLIAPRRMREGLRLLLDLPPDSLRVWGLVLLGLGLLITGLARSL